MSVGLSPSQWGRRQHCQTYRKLAFSGQRGGSCRSMRSSARPPFSHGQLPAFLLATAWFPQAQCYMTPATSHGSGSPPLLILLPPALLFLQRITSSGDSSQEEGQDTPKTGCRWKKHLVGVAWERVQTEWGRQGGCRS